MSSSCDSPQRTRVIDNTVDSGTNSGASSLNDDSSAIDFDSNTTSSSSSSSTTGSSGNNEPGFTNCNLSYQFYSRNIGYFGVCQSTVEGSVMKLKFQTADLSTGNCLVPMNKNAQGKSFALYRVAECVKNNADTNYKVSFPSQNKISNEPVNALMVLKANAVNHFFSCMNAKNSYIQSHYGCSSNPSCMAQADQYAQVICNDFAAIHGDNYKLVSF